MTTELQRLREERDEAVGLLRLAVEWMKPPIEDENLAGWYCRQGGDIVNDADTFLARIDNDDD